MSSAPCSADSPSATFRISTLIFLRDERQRLLLLRRSKSPNLGKWSPIGGKLETHAGESPFECAIRETREETDFRIETDDLHLFAYVSEKHYENDGHWLMFLFSCRKSLTFLPQNGPEGEFSFFERSEIDSISIPENDKLLVWPFFDENAERGFAAVRADCSISGQPKINIEERI
ncbi:MAG: NUDIX hydrolase [Opitutales bacterium]|nr:NUDIX hydrolase [Opitutales bacterium]|tara:strand:+ start:764 stop:1288 length:525 start_codon:yes stop_codon:yes gene_type:complete